MHPRVQHSHDAPVQSKERAARAGRDGRTNVASAYGRICALRRTGERLGQRAGGSAIARLILPLRSRSQVDHPDRLLVPRFGERVWVSPPGELERGAAAGETAGKGREEKTGALLEEGFVGHLDERLSRRVRKLPDEDRRVGKIGPEPPVDSHLARHEPCADRITDLLEALKDRQHALARRYPGRERREET